MGQLTRAQIVTEGLTIAGNTQITTRANIALNAWLRRTYKAWSWPFLVRKRTGIALGAGVQSLVVGAGVGGITLEVQRIADPVWLYDSAHSTQRRCRIAQFQGDDGIGRPETMNPALNVGTPSAFRCAMDTGVWGKFTLYPDVVPDRAYLLSLDTWEQPADIPTDTTGDATVPLFPNDETMIQSVLTAALRYENELEQYQEASNLLGLMVASDRVTYSTAAGIGDVNGLDESFFRRS